VQIGVDIGGTFTDIVAVGDDGRLTLTKVPSTPRNLLEGVSAAVKRVLSLGQGSASEVERFVHGTTVATNAILEQKGALTALLMTEGFEDVLELGRQKRSRMYDLYMDSETPAFLAPRRRRRARVRLRADPATRGVRQLPRRAHLSAPPPGPAHRRPGQRIRRGRAHGGEARMVSTRRLRGNGDLRPRSPAGRWVRDRPRHHRAGRYHHGSTPGPHRDRRRVRQPPPAASRSPSPSACVALS
jgi:Hydantoinase/oxoprolinase N-terminal region